MSTGPIRFSSRVVHAIVYALVIALLSQTSSPATTARPADASRTKGPPAHAGGSDYPVWQTEEIVIPDGTELEVITTEEISSKTSTEGDPVTFKVAEDLFLNNYMVLAKGTLVKGTVSISEESGRLGKGGKLGVRIESTTTVDGQTLKLRASQAKTGNDKTGATIALVALFGVFGFLKKGKDAKIKKGSKTKVFTDEMKRVRVKGGVI